MRIDDKDSTLTLLHYWSYVVGSILPKEEQKSFPPYCFRGRDLLQDFEKSKDTNQSTHFKITEVSSQNSVDAR